MTGLGASGTGPQRVGGLARFGGSSKGLTVIGYRRPSVRESTDSRNSSGAVAGHMTDSPAPSPKDGPDPMLWAEEERALVCALGGYALQLSGGWLVTHERLGGSRFNFIDIGPLAPARRTAFLERALDHYFQRALRPVVRLEPSAPTEIVESLERLGFRERTFPQQLLVRGPGPGGETNPSRPVRPLTAEELPLLYRLWGGSKELPEIRASLDVAVAAPARGEKVVPVAAITEEGPASVGVLHGWNGMWGLHAVTTLPGHRGGGWASDLTIGSWYLSGRAEGGWLGLRLDSHRIPSRLGGAGLGCLVRYRIFELPTDRALEIPPPGPPQPPRWRPPRSHPTQ